MTTVLFLCREEDFHRERRGYVRAFSKKGIKMVTLKHDDGINPDIRSVVDRFAEKPTFILHPDLRLLLPEGLVEVDIPTLCFHIDTFGATYRRIRMSMLFDYACVFHPGFDRLFHQAGHPRPVFLPHAVEAEPFQPMHEERIYEVGWVGHVDKPMYATRRYLLPGLAHRFRMNEWKRSHTPEEVAEVYKRSKIVVNIGRDDYPQDANLRVFEAMAAGALLITSVPTELSALGLQEGQHFVGYRDKDGVEDLVQYYLDHETERHRIGEAARDLVLREHTYDRRVEQILTMLQQDKGQLFAPARRWSQAEVRRTYLVYYTQLHLLDRAFEELRTLREISLWAALKSVPTILREIIWQFRISLRLRDWITGRS